MNKQLKFGVGLGSVLGVAIFLLFAIQLSDAESGLLFGLLIGGITVFVFGVTPMFLTQQTEKLAENESITKKVNQSHSLLIYGSVEKVRQSLSHSARLLTKASIVQEEEDFVVIKTGANFKTFGEQVVVSVEPLNTRQTKLTITSSPLNKSTMVDYGRNAQNVQLIAGYFKTEFSEAIKTNEMNIDYSKKPIFIFDEEAERNRDFEKLNKIRSDSDLIYLKMLGAHRERGEQFLMVVEDKRFGFQVSDHPLDEQLIAKKEGGYLLQIEIVLCQVHTNESNTFCFESPEEQEFVLDAFLESLSYRTCSKWEGNERIIFRCNAGCFSPSILKRIELGELLCEAQS